MSKLETAMDDADKALHLAGDLLREHGIDGVVPTTIIGIASAAIQALRRIAAGKITPAEALAELAKLKAGLAANDAAADAALAAKFPPG